MVAMKTPGVYIVEKNAFPNSVVEVATAVPAFVGYTERADYNGNDLINKPFRISSMAEYHNCFGGATNPRFSIDSATKVASDLIRKDPVSNESTYHLISQKTGKFYLYNSMKLFFLNGGGPCWIVSVGEYMRDGVEATVEGALLEGGIETLIKEQEPTMLVIPDTNLLDVDSAIKVQQAMLSHCGDKMKNRVAILDIPNGNKEKNDGDPVALLRSKLGTNYLSFGIAYYPWVETSIVQDNDISYKNFVGEDNVVIDTLKKQIIDDLKNSKKIEGDEATNPLAQQVERMSNDAEAWRAEQEEGNTLSDDDIEVMENLLQSRMVQISPLFKKIMAEAKNKLNVLPPSAAMAGVYTMVDNLSGVWKAPANVSLNAVIKPTVNISHDDQEDLNVHAQGKSVNAIRSFTGEGTMVWGARTLDGNSLDWRYVQVRRTMIMLEESIRFAVKAYVFESNEANTWITMKSMVRNFLTGIWKRGGLAGKSPDDAFAVHVGLGETMTAEDILEGILRITVLVALIRPAEFIEITFQQQMQES